MANQDLEEAPRVKAGAVTALLRELVGAPEDAWGAALRPGATVGRFELVRELGRGGFGSVWEAKDRELGRSVAFKALRTGPGTGPAEERLLREAEAAARLSHPNLVTLFDVGRSEYGAYLVLELLRGHTLAERLAHGPIGVREAVRIAVEMSKGVAHAHSCGVVHRDLKPSNVFLCDDGQVKVLDFGIAHAFGRRRTDGGTRGYMAPEQAEGAPEDERTDVHALGVMLHEMLSGEVPRAGHRAPVLDVPGVPALGLLVARMLAAAPVQRPRDAAEVLGALAQLQREIDVTPTTGPVRAKRWSRRWIAPVALALAVALALGVQQWRSRRTGAAGAPVTTSVEALEHYLAGERQLDAVRITEAVEEYRKAVAADPGFALAQCRLAYMGEAAGMSVAERRAALEVALRKEDQLPPRERLLAGAVKATLDGDAREASARYARAVEAFPADKTVLFLAATAHVETGRCDLATPLFERVVALAPTWEPAIHQLVHCLRWLGRSEEAVARARVLVEKAPSATAFRALASTSIGAGRLEEAIGAARRALAMDDSVLSRHELSDALILAERYEEAEEVLRPLVAPDQPYLSRMVGVFRLAGAVAHQGRIREALAIVDSHPPDPDGGNVDREWARLGVVWTTDESAEARKAAYALRGSRLLRQFVPSALLLHGDAEGAAELVKVIEPGVGMQQYEALLAWRHGDADRALAILRDAAETSGFRHRAAVQWFRAKVAFEAGRDREVISATDALSRLPSGPFRGHAYAQASYWSAVAYERLGERTRALDRVDRMLALWRRADPDLPLLRQARQLRARLGEASAKETVPFVPAGR